MAKVTSKLQVTIPKLLAREYEIVPGDEIQWLSAGDAIRVLPQRRSRPRLDIDERLALFDAATERQLRRQTEAVSPTGVERPDRGWRRAELYERKPTD